MGINRVVYHEGAADDVRSAITWYQQRSPKAAADFVEELSRAINIFCESPERWPSGKNDTHRFLLCRFPFTIIYSEERSVITIWAVAHGSRRPDY